MIMCVSADLLIEILYNLVFCTHKAKSQFFEGCQSIIVIGILMILNEPEYISYRNAVPFSLSVFTALPQVRFLLTVNVTLISRRVLFFRVSVLY